MKMSFNFVILVKNTFFSFGLRNQQGKVMLFDYHIKI